MHPELGRYGRDVLLGEIAGTLASMAFNATTSPVIAALGKALVGLGVGWYGLKKPSETGVTMWQAGVRMLTSAVEQLSYPSEAKGLAYDVQNKRFWYPRIYAWMPPKQQRAPAQAPAQAPAPQRVVKPQQPQPQPQAQAQQPGIIEL
jgi:hypothetical protein